MSTSTTKRVRARGGRERERAFHPAGDAEGEEKALSPDDGVDAALGAEHPEQKEQRREEEKTHELLHPHHPGAGLRAAKRSQAGCALRSKIGRAHPGRDGEEHEKNDRGRLGEGEAERGAEKRRGAGCGEDGRENALEERAGITFARGPAEQTAGWRVAAA